MEESIKQPLDEVRWVSEEWIHHLNGVRAENIHKYFMYSPFCDVTSNNRVLELQARHNLELTRIVDNRQLFEERLRAREGVEYVVVDGPETTTPNMNPIWVIRKRRRKHYDDEEDSMPVLGTYYAFGHTIYQAPSFLDLMNSRLVRHDPLKISGMKS
jgi:mediator of RNA polymerase II transcription subunit 6